MIVKSNGMTNREYKALFEMLVCEEERIQGISLNIKSLSREQYLKSIFGDVIDTYISSRNNKNIIFKVLKDSRYIKCYFQTSGLTFDKGSYVSLGYSVLDNVNQKFGKFKKRHELSERLFVFYHEMRHLIQHDIRNRKSDVYNIYDVFCNNLCEEYQKVNPNLYSEFHDNFYHEIDANLFGIRKTEMFLKRDSKLFQENKNFIERLKNVYEFNLNNFDFDSFLSGMIQNESLVKYRPKTGYLKSKIIEDNYYNILISYLIPDIKASRSRSKEKLLNSIFSNKDYIISLDLTRISESQKRRIIKALDWKREDLIKRQYFNKDYLFRTNIGERIKEAVDKQNKILSDRIIENNMLHDYVNSFIYQGRLNLVDSYDIRENHLQNRGFRR